jgi:hypothetical protein
VTVFLPRWQRGKQVVTLFYLFFFAVVTLLPNGVAGRVWTVLERLATLMGLMRSGYEGPRHDWSLFPAILGLSRLANEGHVTP